MDNNDNNPLDSFASDIDIGSVDGDRNVDDNSGLSLAEINQITGRDYKDKATALKSLKSTYDMVGKAGKIEKDNKELQTKLEKTTESLGEIKGINERLFYSENPQYKAHKDIISAMGNDPQKVVDSDAFKKVFAGLSELETTKNSKSVLETNPRIGQAKTKIQEAHDLAIKGKQTDANTAAVEAVMNAYEL